MGDSFKGVTAIALACSIWGLSGLFYKAISHIPPLEVLSHRVFWSLAFFLLLLTLQGRLVEFARMFRSWRLIRVITLASLMISMNWFFFIHSIQTGHAVEASLGYYIFPIVTVILGLLIFKEGLSHLQWGAVVLAVIGVCALTYGLSVLPVVALILATTFGFYGVIKKGIQIGPVLSVSAEVCVLVPLALLWLGGVHFLGWTGLTRRAGGYFGTSWFDSMMLITSGPITATPLVLFSYASKRVSLATLGLAQYINPSLQAMVAVFVFHEIFTPWHMVAFVMIWTGLALYSFDGIRRERRMSR